MDTQYRWGGPCVDEFLDCTVDLHSLVFVDGSSAILIPVECATDDVGKRVILPEVLSRDEVVGSPNVSPYDFVVDNDIRLSVGGCKEAEAVYMEVIGHSSCTAVVVVPRL